MSLLQTNLGVFLEVEPEVHSQKYMHKMCICFLFPGSSLSGLTYLF